MPANHSEIEKKLWASADELRANSHLKSSEYSVPVLGLIFLRYAAPGGSSANRRRHHNRANPGWRKIPGAALADDRRLRPQSHHG